MSLQIGNFIPPNFQVRPCNIPFMQRSPEHIENLNIQTKWLKEQLAKEIETSQYPKIRRSPSFSRRRSSFEATLPDPPKRIMLDKNQTIDIDGMQYTLKKRERIILEPVKDDYNEVIKDKFILWKYDKLKIDGETSYTFTKLGPINKTQLNLPFQIWDTFFSSRWVTPKQPLGDAKSTKKEHVVQGNLGNCYFLASLLAVIDKNPTLINNILKLHQSNNTVGVSFQGADPFNMHFSILSSPLGRSHNACDSSIWIQLLEKAYCLYLNHQQGKGPSKTTISDGGIKETVLTLLTGTSYISKHLESLATQHKDPWKYLEDTTTIQVSAELCFYPSMTDYFSDDLATQSFQCLENKQSPTTPLTLEDKKLLLSACYASKKQDDLNDHFHLENITINIKGLLTNFQKRLAAQNQILDQNPSNSFQVEKIKNMNKIKQLLEKLDALSHLDSNLCITIEDLTPLKNHLENHNNNHLQLKALKPNQKTCYVALDELLSKKTPIVASTKSNIEEKIKTTRPHLQNLLINRHAYAVLETVKHENTFFVKLRNPQGGSQAEFDITIEDFITFFQDIAVPADEHLYPPAIKQESVTSSSDGSHSNDEA